MKKIKELVEWIDDELDGAKGYAEKAVEFRLEGESAWANKFKTMAQNELDHVSALHELAVTEITKARNVLTPPQDMLDRWEKAHTEYMEKAAWVKQMLTL